MNSTVARALLAACLLLAPVPALSQDEPKPKTTPTPKEAPKSCDGQFLAQRRREPDWYPDRDFKDKVAYCKPGAHQVAPTQSIPVYWAVIANDWTTATAKAKVDAAKKWFERYCVTIDDKFVDLANLKNYTKKVKELDAANASGRDDYQKVIYEDYVQTWSYAGAPKGRFLMVLFVDPYKEVEFTATRWSDVSANYAIYPLILITAKDKGRDHILTHELVHGLGKVLKPSVASSAATKVVAPAESKPYYDGLANSKSTWDEAPCEEDMGNSKNLSAKDAAPVDWASYWEWLKVATTLK